VDGFYDNMDEYKSLNKLNYLALKLDKKLAELSQMWEFYLLSELKKYKESSG